MAEQPVVHRFPEEEGAFVNAYLWDSCGRRPPAKRWTA